jgi:hypothetical protein
MMNMLLMMMILKLLSVEGTNDVSLFNIANKSYKKVFPSKRVEIRDDLVSCVLVNEILGVLPRCKIEEQRNV